MSSAYHTLINVLVEKLGFVVLENEEDDFAISDYVVDSITFIQFIIAIEEEVGKQLSDDFLVYDILTSAKGYAEKLDAYINE